jgi:hypothetical protein
LSSRGSGEQGESIMHKANAPRFCAPGDDVHLEKSGITWW